MKTLLIALVLFLAFCVASIHVSRIMPAGANGPIYIRADGSIDPPDALVSSINNVTYALTNNIGNSMVVERDNITLDGAGFTIQGLGAYDSRGIDLSQRLNVTLKNVEIKGFGLGVFLFNSSINTVSACHIENNRIGVWMSRSSRNNLFGNNVTTNDENGIVLMLKSAHNRIARNTIEGNYYGLRLEYNSDYNEVCLNNIVDSNGSGILFYQSSNNRVYHNNFVNPHFQAYSDLSTNIWEEGSPLEGNYWSDYTGADAKSGAFQNETGSDGIGDLPYRINSSGADNRPLMGILTVFSTSSGFDVSVVSNSTVEDLEYFQSNRTIRMHVSNMTASQTFGFIRICIPYALMNETAATIDGAGPSYSNYNIAENGTHKWAYFNYQHSRLEVLIIPEFSNALITGLLATVSLFAVATFRKIHSTL